jgi:hypothetical protein
MKSRQVDLPCPEGVDFLNVPEWLGEAEKFKMISHPMTVNKDALSISTFSVAFTTDLSRSTQRLSLPQSESPCEK